MADIFLRNIDLMRQGTTRRNINEPQNGGVSIRYSSLVWEDIQLLQFAPTRLRQRPIPRCTSITIQVGYIFTAVPGGAPWPVVSIRDSNVASLVPLTVTNGIELIPGAMISFEVDDQEIQSEIFLTPTEYWAFLNNVGQVRLHICYGVLQ